jgi:hypothetical protein
MWATYVIKKLPKVNNRPLGVNSPNLVTLILDKHSQSHLVTLATGQLPSGMPAEEDLETVRLLSVVHDQPERGCLRKTRKSGLPGICFSETVPYCFPTTYWQCIHFDKKWVVIRFGQFLHKPIRSPCPRLDSYIQRDPTF